jgi:hypothetical protein
MRTLEITSAVALVLTFLTSGILKLRNPSAIGPLLEEVGWWHASTRVTAQSLATLELIAGIGMLFAQRWAFALAGGLVLVFSIAVAAVAARGSRPRCGCLGDFSVARVGRFHLARNIVILCAIVVAAVGPADRPTAALVPAAALAFLMLALPEAFETVAEFRRSVRGELRAAMERSRTT